ncbi:MAG: U32 family peptidase [Candidatus Krumholzibacteriia bacterium]
MPPTSLELLAPAKDLATGLAAVNCGADAVYIGAPRFGAREAAGNALADIASLAAYAHRYWAKVYVTLNTLLRDDELDAAVRLAHQVHDAGADALIIQDMGLLECDLPPLPLFASTQMHNHTPERVKFLEGVGFQRVILARELSVAQIRTIRATTSVPLEAFVHGALCVCYSGQCALSQAIGGRSANRGQCAQPCRRPYSLVDAAGNTLIKDRHLLSIHDLNLTDQLGELAAAGVTSFKIEGRLKDRAYVMNVVAHYRQALDALGARKASSGRPVLDFTADPAKTFNRGFTSYFATGRRRALGSPDTPKMVGERIGRIRSVTRASFTLEQGSARLNAGDGISFFAGGELTGTLVNRAEGDVIHPARMDGLVEGVSIHRNRDHAFITRLNRSRAARKIDVDLALATTPAGLRLEARDEDGVAIVREVPCDLAAAEKPAQARATVLKQLAKLGETEFACRRIEVADDWRFFLPVAVLNDLRRQAVAALRERRLGERPRAVGRMIVDASPYPDSELTFLGNVLNRKAEQFYRRHGVTAIEPAAEAGLDLRGRVVMTTHYCLKYQQGACPREGQDPAAFGASPVFLVDEDGRRLRLEFDCAACVMKVIDEGPAESGTR